MRTIEYVLIGIYKLILTSKTFKNISRIFKRDILKLVLRVFLITKGRKHQRSTHNV